MMIKKKKKIFICIMIVILITCIIAMVLLFIRHPKKEHQEYIQECYRKQNNAFLITGDYIYSVSNNYKNINKYNTHEKIEFLPLLYAYLKFYEGETDIVITLDDVKEYLSSEYEKNGSLRIYKNHEIIKGYVDYMYNDYQQRYKHKTELQDFDYKLMGIRNDIRNNHKEYSNYNFSNFPLPFVDEMIKKVYDPNYEIDYSLLTPKE